MGTNFTTKHLTLLTITILAISCNYVSKKENSKEEAGYSEELKHVSLDENVDNDEHITMEACLEDVSHTRTKVYSSSFKGFLDIYSEASETSVIVGRLQNGEDEATLVCLEDEWCKVEWRDTIGYVQALYLQSYPGLAVTSNVSVEWLTGVRKGEESTLLIFDNGTYLKYTHADFPYRSEVGFYILEEDYIAFRRILLLNQQAIAEYSELYYQLNINSKVDSIGTYCNKEHIWETYEDREEGLCINANQSSTGATWYYELTWTIEEFEQEKMWAMQQIKKMAPEYFEIPSFLIDDNVSAEQITCVEELKTWLENNNLYRYSGSDSSMSSSTIQYANKKFYYIEPSHTSPLNIRGSISYDSHMKYGYATVIDEEMDEFGIDIKYTIEVYPDKGNLYLITDDTTFTFSLY